MKQEGETFGRILLERLKFFGAVFLCIIIDGLFLIAWLAIHWLLGKGQSWFDPEGIEKFTSIILRGLLEIPLFILVIIFIIADIKRISLRIFQGARKDLS